MGAKFIFTVRKGALAGKTFTFTGKEPLIVGRLRECSIVLPDATVSPRHCRIDVAIPWGRVRDLESEAGTCLNGVLIGQRSADLGEHEWNNPGREFLLAPGDRLGLGEGCELELQVKLSQYCGACSEEMEDSDNNDPEGLPLCRACRKLHLEGREKAAAEAAGRIWKRQRVGEKYLAARAEAVAKLEAAWWAWKLPTGAKELKNKRRKGHGCEVCGAALDGGEDGLCARCRANPKRMLFFLLEQAGRGKKAVREIDGYHRIKILGQGGLNQVSLVAEEASGKLMVLKRMIINMAAVDDYSRMRFLREAHIGGQLEHENIVRRYKAGQDEKSCFFLMELCEGGSVAELLREHGGILNLELATRIILQALDGLDYAHNAPLAEKLDTGETVTVNGIVHRDFKPGNILLCSRNNTLTAKVADFGLAKAFECRYSLKTPQWHVLGTPKFMPSQQSINFTDSKPEVDVWAAAATYYHMLTGCFAKPESPDQENIYEFMMRERIPIRQRNPAIPKKLAEVIDYALLEEPEIGVSSARELKRMILEAL